MKISNEKLRAIQEQEAQRARTQKSSDDFTDILSRQLDAGQAMSADGVSQSPVSAQGVSVLPMTGMQANGLDSNPADFEEATTRMESMFSTFEQYADTIGREGTGDLREAYSLLESMNSQIAGFKERFPDASAQQPQFASLLNEIDVLATTETFKFNRGDYYQ